MDIQKASESKKMQLIFLQTAVKVRSTLWFQSHSFDLSFEVFCFEKDDLFF